MTAQPPPSAPVLRAPAAVGVTARDTTPPATVAQVLAGRVPAGRVVRVRGRCLGYGGAAGAGPPPRTRSDWLLGDGRRSVYVTGPFPPACVPMTGGGGEVRVVARAAVDTVAGRAGRRAARWYLVSRPAGGPR